MTRRSMAVKVDRRRPPRPTYRIQPSDIAYVFAVAFGLTVLVMVSVVLIVEALT